MLILINCLLLFTPAVPHAPSDAAHTATRGKLLDPLLDLLLNVLLSSQINMLFKAWIDQLLDECIGHPSSSSLSGRPDTCRRCHPRVCQGTCHPPSPQAGLSSRHHQPTLRDVLISICHPSSCPWIRPDGRCCPRFRTVSGP